MAQNQIQYNFIANSSFLPFLMFCFVILCVAATAISAVTRWFVHWKPNTYEIVCHIFRKSFWWQCFSHSISHTEMQVNYKFNLLSKTLSFEFHRTSFQAQSFHVSRLHIFSSHCLDLSPLRISQFVQIPLSILAHLIQQRVGAIMNSSHALKCFLSSGAVIVV